MNDFCIDFSRLLKNNETVKLNVANSSKGPHAGNKVQITKDNNRTHYYYDKPTTIDVGGKKIKNVIDYSTIKFKDGTTNNGQSFDITTTKSHINAYTHDNKFYLLDEYHEGIGSYKIGDKVLKGNISKRVNADNSKIITIINKNLKINKINIDANGNIAQPIKSNSSKIASSVVKCLKSLIGILKF